MFLKNLFYFTSFFLILPCAATEVESQIVQPKKVGVTFFDYFDSSRKRPLGTTLWYPVEESVEAKDYSKWWVQAPQAKDAKIADEQKKYPLILFSHGYGNDRLTSSWFSEWLASNGFIVATLDHYGNTGDQVDEIVIQPWLRAQDVSFVLTKLLADEKWKAHIDIDKIGAAGFSLGGITALWLGGAQANFKDIAQDIATALPDNVHPGFYQAIDYSIANGSFKDDRIKALFVMAPGFGGINSVFTSEGLAKVDIPVYMVVGEGDKTTPSQFNAEFFAKYIPNIELNIIKGFADHFVFINSCTLQGTRMKPEMCYNHPQVDRKAIHEMVAKAAIQFFNTHLERS